MKSRIGLLGASKTPLTTFMALMLVSAAMAQQTQTPYTAPAQPYPTTTPAYPTPPSPYPTPTPAYPTPIPAYPAFPGQPTAGCQIAPPAPQSHFFRDLFAQTIAAVLQTSAGGLLATITGRIMAWFTRKGANTANPNPYAAQNPQYPAPSYGSASPTYASPAYAATPTGGCPSPAYPSPAYPSPVYASTPAYAGASQTAATYPGATPAYASAGGTYSTPPPAYPTTAYTSAPAYPGTTQSATPYPGQMPAYGAAAAAYPTPNSYPTTTQPAYPSAVPTQVYDARTGQLVAADANPYATRDIPAAGTLYAGIAYEVHAQAADGTYSTPINTATYEFHTGDKFMVYYRPSLPGHMEIYNINAGGKQSLIESSNMPAGQMVALGPYQFTNESGEESLRLVLSPCSNSQLITATRDIVKVDALPQPAAVGVAVQLGDCGAPTARGLEVHTRDIEKVGVEGTTSFALDPVSPKELKSGQVTPRQMTIVFHHR